jgi:sulfur-oxidizing protein SoxZ
MAIRALLNVPSAVRRGEVFEVRATVQHPMETGFRVGNEGQMLARDLVRRVEARLDGELVFAADLHPSIAANPYLAFSLTCSSSATLVVAWRGDHGFAHSESAVISVA